MGEDSTGRHVETMNDEPKVRTMNEKRKSYRALLAGASLETITADDLPGAMRELARRYPDLPAMGWYRATKIMMEGRIGDFGFKIEEVAR